MSVVDESRVPFLTRAGRATQIWCGEIVQIHLKELLKMTISALFTYSHDISNLYVVIFTKIKRVLDQISNLTLLLLPSSFLFFLPFFIHTVAVTWGWSKWWQKVTFLSKLTLLFFKISPLVFHRKNSHILHILVGK